ncbi:hypothetical protein [Acinetobacter bereziniae]|uniref:hypothetical protein n=1 Tax=Acinetobacter bereziniae TaxID=106648 RepID=UPI0002AE9FB4|nr:hypothetical protein [Acinetobacter bereziniae]ELW86544.1 hypothetical protein ACINWC743_2921 [Acinetobacter sp. WC-743]
MDADITVRAYNFLFKPNDMVVICAINHELRSKQKIIDRKLNIRSEENNDKMKYV